MQKVSSETPPSRIKKAAALTSKSAASRSKGRRPSIGTDAESAYEIGVNKITEPENLPSPRAVFFPCNLSFRGKPERADAQMLNEVYLLLLQHFIHRLLCRPMKQQLAKVFPVVHQLPAGHLVVPDKARHHLSHFFPETLDIDSRRCAAVYPHGHVPVCMRNRNPPPVSFKKRLSRRSVEHPLLSVRQSFQQHPCAQQLQPPFLRAHRLQLGRKERFVAQHPFKFLRSFRHLPDAPKPSVLIPAIQQRHGQPSFLLLSASGGNTVTFTLNIRRLFISRTSKR